MTELLNCPFCGKSPFVEPARPEIEGNAWTRISCVNVDCPAYDGVKVCQDTGHFEACAELWNRRATTSPWRPDREAIARILHQTAILGPHFGAVESATDQILVLSQPPSADHIPDATKLVEPSHTVAQSHTALSQPPSGGAELEALKAWAIEHARCQLRLEELEHVRDKDMDEWTRLLWRSDTAEDSLDQAARAYADSVEQEEGR